ncbi:MAG: hypothetical protein LQ343_001890 [Gyalolechia ehrenbergii]|nr:MAG: hypothetical protein LQ343_001890 [Gyalolechia ehrenbergii]
MPSSFKNYEIQCERVSGSQGLGKWDLEYADQYIPYSTTLLLFLSALFTLCASRLPECDARTKPPKNPSFSECGAFLEYLSIKAHSQPPGEYRWYGRKIEACTECVKLPSIIHHGRVKCAAIVDVDDEHEDDLSIFGLSDLRQALADVMGICWLAMKHNGRGYPGSQAAWAAFTQGVNPRLRLAWKGITTLGYMSQDKEDKNVSVIDLSKW